MAVYNFSNSSPPTTLDGNINSTVTTLDVISASGYPAVPFKIRIGAEVITVGAKASNTFSTLTRGDDATANVAHTDTDPVEHVVTAEDIMPRYDSASDSYKMDKTLEIDIPGSALETYGDATTLFHNFFHDGTNLSAQVGHNTSADDFYFRSLRGSILIQAQDTEDDLGAGIFFYTDNEIGVMRQRMGIDGASGDIDFRKKEGVVSLLWDESDAQWEFKEDVHINSQLRIAGTTPLTLGGAGDAQLRWTEGANDYRVQMGNNANVFTRRLQFTSSDHASPHDISFHDGDNDAVVTFLWDNGAGIWKFDTDLSMNVNSKIIDVEDPTAGNHVGDRAYNDARYVLQ